jgi:amidophosphoribosyltransferase
MKGSFRNSLSKKEKTAGDGRGRSGSTRGVRERPRDACGVFGIYGADEAANLTYLGLYALQHRGQESAGIISSDGRRLHSHRQMGLVADVFNENVLTSLPGRMAIGHVRYSTSGESRLDSAQPFSVEYSRGSLAIAHNGNLVNAALLRDELEAYGSIFQSTMDTEVIVHLIAHSKASTLESQIIDAVSRVKGAYSAVMLTDHKLVALRDPHGFRPLVLGKLKDAWVVASETCALDLIEASFERDVEPGELIVVGEEGLNSLFPWPKRGNAFCIFEYIYFARPDSNLYGQNVYAIRKALGAQLAREKPVPCDVVIAVPDSGVPAAMGYAEEAQARLELGLIRNHYVGRTFIEPQQSIRHFGVKIKLNAVRGALEGRRVVVVDDSIVRGTTMRKIVRMIRQAGAREVHVRISAPPTEHSCYYGIDTPTREELIASSTSVEEISRFITADSLGYLSVEGMHAAASSVRNTYCDACFTGNYPVEIPEETHPPQLPLFE